MAPPDPSLEQAATTTAPTSINGAFTNVRRTIEDSLEREGAHRIAGAHASKSQEVGRPCCARRFVCAAEHCRPRWQRAQQVRRTHDHDQRSFNRARHVSIACSGSTSEPRPQHSPAVLRATLRTSEHRPSSSRTRMSRAYASRPLPSPPHACAFSRARCPAASSPQASGLLRRMKTMVKRRTRVGAPLGTDRLVAASAPHRGPRRCRASRQ
jgi:hypothetical protein